MSAELSWDEIEDRRVRLAAIWRGLGYPPQLASSLGRAGLATDADVLALGSRELLDRHIVGRTGLKKLRSLIPELAPPAKKWGAVLMHVPTEELTAELERRRVR